MHQAELLKALQAKLATTAKMPLLFLGHGTPMHALAPNPTNQSWAELAQLLPRPQAIVVISAHWCSRGKILVNTSTQPATIHDFAGFPAELYEERYSAPGQPVLAQHVMQLLQAYQAEADQSWGLDHGAWSVLKWLYPQADIPVFQISIDLALPLNMQLMVGQQLSLLRQSGVLLLGSGNIVHNLAALRFDGGAQPFATEFDQDVARCLTERNWAKMADLSWGGDLMRQAHPTLEHYIPALIIAGAATAQDELYMFNQSIELGAISMRSFVFYGD